MATAAAQWDDIYRGNGSTTGRLRLASTGLGWKSSADGQTPVITVGKADIKWAQWIRVARHFQLRLGLHRERVDRQVGDRRRESFEGFAAEDYEKLSSLFKQHYDTAIEHRDISLRGWNWGRVDIQGSDLAFLVSGKPAFDIPLTNVVNSSISKTEVTLELSDTTSDAKADFSTQTSPGNNRKVPSDQLVEMRFFVPGKAPKSDVDDDGSELDVDGLSAAQVLYELVKERADIGRVAGEEIVTFPEVLCTTPRGRFDIDMYNTFLRLRGKTYEYKILYSSIQRLFLLPKPDDIHFNFVVQLEPPIRQGLTRYPFLVMQFVKDEEMDAELNMDEEKLTSCFQQKHNKIEGQAHEVVSVVFKGLSKKKVIFPQSFQSVNGHAAIKCNLKANEGLLYFLEKFVLFVSKQPILIPNSDIHYAKFARVGGALQSSRTFDLLIIKRDGSEVQFSSLSREEHPGIEDYFKSRDKKVLNEIADDISATGAAVAALLEDEDMDDVSDNLGADKTVGVKAGDDTETDDESFQGGSSGSDVAEEYDSNYGGSDSSGDSGDQDKAGSERPAKKRKK